MKKHRLLIFFLLGLFPLSLTAIEPFKPADRVIFLHEPCSFSTVIPKVPPNQVQITVQSLPEHVSLLSSQKQEVFLDGLKSTALFVVLRFSETGTYNIAPIAARIQYGSRFISFLPVTVYDNPKNTKPRLYMAFEHEDGTSISAFSVGTPVRSVLYGMFFSKILSINEIASEFGIFLPKDTVHQLPFTVKDFATEAFVLAVYEFIPFQEGEYSLTAITANMTSWAGNDEVVTMEPKEVRVAAKAGNLATSSGENTKIDFNDTSMFPGAFDPIVEESKAETKSFQEDADELFTKFSLRRILLVYTFLGFLLLSLLCAVLWIILHLAKKKKRVFGFLVFIFLGTAILSALLLIPRYGVFFGGSVYTIPETASKTSFSTSSPAIVRIHLNTGAWSYISFPAAQKQSAFTNGWVQTKFLRVITTKN